MAELEPAQFAAFYRELHGRTPYAWQVRAARELCEGNVWPSLTAPTGAGKTTLIDCWLFALAATGNLPRRLFWVIDRRAVIDQIFEYARGVAERLEHADGTSTLVRERLREIGGGHELEVRLWRGALDDERAAETLREPLAPSAAAIVCSTIDQVGSRLLFSGYGIARRSRPLHAGLIGLDSLIVLDEAHLSQPFLDTVRCVSRQQRAGELPVTAVRAIALTATPRDREGGFELTPEELAEPPIARRVNAIKRARLVDPKRGERQVSCLVRVARDLAQGGGRVVGVVVNTVAVARETFDLLADRGQALLVIGPSRPLDRDGLLERIPGREERAEMDAPLFVVGTQTLEVGLDLDLDALVTACAPLQALVQRLGRLDREGVLGESQAAIIAPAPTCPVYGEATGETWKWLAQQGSEVDLGVVAIRRLLLGGSPPAPPQPLAPILAPWHVEALAQTSFGHAFPPEVALFLRGDEVTAPEVQVAWRADLDPAAAEREWNDRARARPPHPGELLTLPLWALRRWLRDAEGAADLPDLEGAGRPAAGEPTGDGRRAVRVPSRGPDGELDPEVVAPDGVQAGDTLLMPSAYGGCDSYGWSPTARKPVVDLGNLAAAHPRLLLTDALGAPAALLRDAASVHEQLANDEIAAREAYRALREVATAWLADGGGFARDSTAAARSRRLVLPPAGEALVLDGELVLVGTPPPRDRRPRWEVAYRDHADAVERLARAEAEACGLPVNLVETIAHAARHHDLGKLDPRFQAWLADGAEDPATPLAKSRDDGRSWARREAARAAAGWPQGKRHELLSAALLERVDPWPAEIDRDLVLHLVVSHHGYGRPFFLVVGDPDAPTVEVQVDGRGLVIPGDAAPDWAAHAQRLAGLSDRYGPWGLGLLEAVLVLADRAVSAAEGAG